MDILVVYNSDTQNLELNLPNIRLIDLNTSKGKKEGWKLKSYYGAKQDPFAVILDNKKTVKAFYSEAEDVIESLTNYLKENGY